MASVVSEKIYVKVKNEIDDIKKCIKLAYDSDFEFKGIVKYHGDFYLILLGGKEEFLSAYTILKSEELDLNEHGRIKRAIYNDDDNFTGFAISSDDLHEYLKSLYGKQLGDPPECECCKVYVWKVEVPNLPHKIKKLLKCAIGHYSMKCFPVGIYHQDGQYYIMFNSNGRKLLDCIIGQGFDNISFSDGEYDGDRITRQHRYGFSMHFNDFWDYVECLIELSKKDYEKMEKIYVNKNIVLKFASNLFKIDLC